MSIRGFEFGELGHWADVIPPGPLPGPTPAPPAPIPSPRPTTGIPAFPPLSRFSSQVPADCANVKALVYGRSYGTDFAIPPVINNGDVVIVAARWPREISWPRDRIVIEGVLGNVTFYLGRISEPFWAGSSGSGYMLGNWAMLLDTGRDPQEAIWSRGSHGLTTGFSDSSISGSFYAPVDNNVIFLAFICRGAPCSMTGINAAASQLQREIQRATGTPVLAMSAKAQSKRWSDLLYAAHGAVGALEDLGAAIASVFSTSITWDYRRSFMEYEDRGNTMQKAIRIADNPATFAATYLAQARSVMSAASMVPTNDPRAADGAYVRISNDLTAIDRMIVADIALFTTAQRIAAMRSSAVLDRDLVNLPTTIKGYVERKISSSRVVGRDRQLWLGCRWWTEAENQYPAIEADLSSRISYLRTLESWFSVPANVAKFGPATAQLEAVRTEIARMQLEISRLRSQLNLAWYEKKIFGPFTPVGLGVTALGVGVVFKIWKARRLTA